MSDEPFELFFQGPPPGFMEWGEPQMVTSLQVAGVYGKDGELNSVVLRIESEHNLDDGRDMTLPLVFVPEMAKRLKEALTKAEQPVVIDDKEE